MRQKPQERWSSQQGFTLLELLVSMMLFSVAFLGFASLQAGVIQANAKAARRSFAETFAQETVERIRNGAACANGSVTPQGAITYSLQCVTSAGPDNTQDVTVTVTWWAPTAQSVVLKTRI